MSERMGKGARVAADTSGPGDGVPAPPRIPEEKPLLQVLDLDLLAPSKTNPTERASVEEIAELADSIRASGVIQPIIVRVLPADGGHPRPFEIVCGHRRCSAARVAGLEGIPAIVRNLSDADAFELQLVENIQRKDITPLQEAEWFRRLRDELGYSIDAIVYKTGKSRSHVHSRLALTNLPDPARRLLERGDINAGVALLIARIPDEDLQAQAAEAIEFGTPTFAAGDERSHLPLTLEQAKALVRERFMLHLANATFDPKDGLLIESAGPCTTCPRRTGNATDLFGDVDSADVCTSPKCFAAKEEKAWERTAAAAGIVARVLSIEASKRALAPNGYPLFAWVRPDDKRGDGKQTWRQAVRGIPKSYLARDSRNGDAVQLWKRSEVERLLQAGKAPEAEVEKQSPKAPAVDHGLERVIAERAENLFDLEIAKRAKVLSDSKLIDALAALPIFYQHALKKTLGVKGKPTHVQAKQLVAVHYTRELWDERHLLGVDRTKAEKLARAQVLAERKAAQEPKPEPASKGSAKKARPARKKKGGRR